MRIDGFEKIKKYYNFVKSNKESCSFLSFHKMKDGTPFAIICSKDCAEAVLFNPKKKLIERLCLAIFDVKMHGDGYSYLHVASVKSSKRGLGVGSEIFNVLKHHAIKNNCKQIELISVESAEMFYDKIGFKTEDAKGVKLKTYKFDLREISKIPLKKDKILIV